MTHTYAELEVSSGTYNEVKKLLTDAGYGHAFMEDGAIDMHGIGLTKKEAPKSVSVIINGMSCEMAVSKNGGIGYSDIVAKEYGDELGKVRVLSCTFRTKNGTGGILLPNEFVKAEDGIIFNLAHTGNS